MVARRRKNSVGGSDASAVSATDKIARLLAVFITKDIEDTKSRVSLLRSVGFDVAETAAVLGMTENAVSIASHRAQKAKRRKSK